MDVSWYMMDDMNKCSRVMSLSVIGCVTTNCFYLLWK